MKYRKHFSELMVSYDQMTNMGEHMQIYMNRNGIQDEEIPLLMKNAADTAFASDEVKAELYRKLGIK